MCHPGFSDLKNVLISGLFCHKADRSNTALEKFVPAKQNLMFLDLVAL